jgi:hypothetical protein
MQAPPFASCFDLSTQTEKSIGPRRCRRSPTRGAHTSTTRAAPAVFDDRSLEGPLVKLGLHSQWLGCVREGAGTVLVLWMAQPVRVCAQRVATSPPRTTQSRRHPMRASSIVMTFVFGLGLSSDMVPSLSAVLVAFSHL